MASKSKKSKTFGRQDWPPENRIVVTKFPEGKSWQDLKDFCKKEVRKYFENIT